MRGEEVPTMSDVDTSDSKRRRNKRWPEALKREIVAARFYEIPADAVMQAHE